PPEATSRTETIQPHLFEWRNGQLVPPGPQGMQRFQQLFQDKKGNWVLKAPRNGGAGQSMSSMIIRQDENGESLEIRRDADGKYTVMHGDKNGKTSTHTYDSASEFKTADPDAYKVYKEKKPAAMNANPFGPGGAPGFQFQFGDPDFDRQFREMMERSGRGQWGGQGNGFGVGPMSGEARSSFQRQPDGSIKVTTRQNG